MRLSRVRYMNRVQYPISGHKWDGPHEDWYSRWLISLGRRHGLSIPYRIRIRYRPFRYAWKRLVSLVRS